MLVRLEDCLFEGLPNALAMEWPVRFTIALRDSGADEEALRRACMRFLYTTVSRSLERYADAETRAACQPALAVVAVSAQGRAVSEIKAAAALAAAYTEMADTLIAEIEAARAAAEATALAAITAAWAGTSTQTAADEAAATAAAALAMRAALGAAYTEMADALIAEIEAAS